MIIRSFTLNGSFGRFAPRVPPGRAFRCEVCGSRLVRKNVAFTMRFVYGHLWDGFVGVFAGEVARSLRFLAWVLQGSPEGLCIAEVPL